MAKFALFVSAVPGRLASRPGSPHAYIGARLTTPAERKQAEEAGEDPVPAIWDAKQVVPVTQSEYLRYPLDWTKLISNGDVVERTEKDFKAYTDELGAVEKKRDEQLADEAKKAEEAAKKKLKDEADAKKKASEAGSQ